MSGRVVLPPTAADIRRAREIVARHLPTTPVVASPLLGPRVVLKVESLQPTGSFKVRGALAAVAAAGADDPDRPVVAASTGNHGLGVAFAAATYGMRAVIVVPENASPAKVEALERFEAEIVRHGRSYDEAEAHALVLAAAGGRFVSAYNDPHVIAGQATVALELFEQVPELTTITVPVGGGGLLAGVALAAAGRGGVAVRGVETDASPAVSSAVVAGEVRPVTVGPTLADGLAGNLEPGSVTVALIAAGVEQLTGCDERAMADAVRFLAFEHGLVVEPSGAVVVGALLSGRLEPGPGPGAVVVTGRNVAGAVLGDLLTGER